MNELRQESRQLPGKITPFFFMAALIPTLGYLASIGLAEANRWGAPTIEVAIEGYDPRDLVRGHFLNYQIALDSKTHNNLESEPVQGDRYAFSHACAMRAEAGLSPVVLFNHTAPAACETDLPIDFVRDTHRFYVQQDQALELEHAVLAKRATVKLRLISARQVTADQLLVDGKIVSSR